MAEEIRTSQDEPPSQSTTIQLAFIPPGPISNNSRAFGATEYIALLDENSIPGTVLELAQANINVEPGKSVILELQNSNGKIIKYQIKIVRFKLRLFLRYFRHHSKYN